MQCSWRLLAAMLAQAVVLGGCSGAEDTSLIGGGADGGGVTDTGAKPDTSMMDVTPPKDVQAMDVQPGPDSGPGKTPIFCGSMPALSCTAPDQECCRQGFFQYTYACEMPGQCVGMSIPCDKAQNCASLGMPGTVCCGHYSQQGQQVLVDAVSCKPAGMCTQQQSSVVMCDPNDPNSCTGGLKCQQSQTSIPGYYICR